MTRVALATGAAGLFGQTDAARRPTPLLLICLVASLSVWGCGAESKQPTVPSQSYALELRNAAGLQLPARVQGPNIELATPAGFEDRFWPGVNLGATIPGRSPGEVAIGGEEFRRWMPLMARMGVRVLRIYSLQDPAFYRELRAYNQAHPEAPLYVIHGTSIPEDLLAAREDLWDPELLAEQERLIDEVYRAASGDLARAQRLGEASGVWEADIRPWIIGWSFGIELDPLVLQRSEGLNPERAYRGRYLRTRGRASSTEAWLAKQLDHLATLDADAGWSRPVTFTNWLTLDPLTHPMEPLPEEDLVAVDATRLQATRAWPGGFFASYHAYPYFPDFLRFEYSDQADPYRAYLRDLRAHHRGQAVMITEFGVPSSLGSAHLGPLGRDQGGHSEAEAMRIDADLLRAIEGEGFAGALAFEWIDEWFKATWNTLDLELPEERRQLWRNALTNEESFGLMAAEAALEDEVTIDGDETEWEGGSAPSQVLWESEEGLRQIRVAHDEAYLYVVLRFDDSGEISDSVIGLDVRPGGNGDLPWPGPASMEDAEVALLLGPDQLEIQRAAWTDELAFLYGLDHGYLEVRAEDLQRGSGAWRRPQLILSQPFEIPTTNRSNPIELQDLSRHPWRGEDTDSRTLGEREEEVVELRVPWALLGFADPSSRTLVLPRRGDIATEQLRPGATLGIEVFDRDGDPLGEAAGGYGWEPWQSVTWSERLKAGADTLGDAFRDSAR
jgi:hypothetical protein